MKYLRLVNYYLLRYQNLIIEIVTRFITGIIALSVCIASFSPIASAQFSKPTEIVSGKQINDFLTDKDIPLGQKEFARDYVIYAQKDERLEITVSSESFDTVLRLLDNRGEVIAENDDADSTTTNSLIFFKVRRSGNYIVRVSAFGSFGGGKFTLSITKLQVVN